MKTLLIAAFSAAALLLSAAPADAGAVGHSKSKAAKAQKESKSAQKKEKNKSAQKKEKKAALKSANNLLIACGTGDLASSVIAGMSGSCFGTTGANDKNYFGTEFDGSDYSYVDGQPYGDDTWYRIASLETPGGEENLFGELFGYADISVEFNEGEDQRSGSSGSFDIDVSGLTNVGNVMVALKYSNEFQTYLLGDLLGLMSTQGNVISFNFGDLPHGLSHLTFYGTQGSGGPVSGPPPSAVPIPGALPLFASALVGGAILRRRKKAADNA